MSNALRPLNELISLKGKAAVITGAASGIGKAMAFRFAEAGADLHLLDINMEGLEKVRSELSNFHVQVALHGVDLSKKKDIDSFWEELQGDPDILINNAGIYTFKDFLELDQEFLERTMMINTYSVLWMCQHFIKRRKGKGGVIINVSSIEAILPFAKGLVHYDVSKAGVIALSRALAREYGKEGFRVNVLVPGGIETESVKKLKKETIFKLKMDVIQSGKQFYSRLPIGRMGKPDEVALVALFLASDLSTYVHGALIPVDGGFLST